MCVDAPDDASTCLYGEGSGDSGRLWCCSCKPRQHRQATSRAVPNSYCMLRLTCTGSAMQSARYHHACERGPRCGSVAVILLLPVAHMGGFIQGHNVMIHQPMRFVYVSAAQSPFTFTDVVTCVFSQRQPFKFTCWMMSLLRIFRKLVRQYSIVPM
jgi:hypothetical protein